MPGTYPKEWFDTQEKRDAFWNVRLGTMFSFFPAFLIGFVVSQNPVIFSLVAFIVFCVSLYIVFRFNIFGRLMSKWKWINEES